MLNDIQSKIKEEQLNLDSEWEKHWSGPAPGGSNPESRAVSVSLADRTCAASEF